MLRQEELRQPQRDAVWSGHHRQVSASGGLLHVSSIRQDVISFWLFNYLLYKKLKMLIESSTLPSPPIPAPRHLAARRWMRQGLSNVRLGKGRDKRGSNDALIYLAERERRKSCSIPAGMNRGLAHNPQLMATFIIRSPPSCALQLRKISSINSQRFRPEGIDEWLDGCETDRGDEQNVARQWLPAGDDKPKRVKGTRCRISSCGYIRPEELFHLAHLFI